MSKIILLYTFLIFLLLIVFQLLKMFFISGSIDLELYAGIAALIFLSIGFYFGLRKNQDKPEINFENNHALSPREVEVLYYLATGMSNQEIGDHLFVSLNTVKTHLKNIYDKLGVTRRTQAIEVARKSGIIS